MKQTIKYLIILFVASILSSCADFEELEENPNRPASVPASLVLRGVLSDLNEEPWSLAHRQNQFWACNYAYYGSNEYWTNVEFEYLTLKNVLKMEEEAAKSGNKATPYAALAKYLKAVLYTKMTQRVGDLPLDEALKGLALDKPSYNTQKQVYVQVLSWLDEANEDLKVLISNNDLTLQGDIFYNGDLKKWQKAVNTFKLRVLISLSKKTADTDLRVASRFAEVVNNPANFPVMTSNADNMNYVYNGTTQIYPTSPGNKGFDKGRYNMAQTYVKGLTDLNDPRVFVTCNPAAKKIKPIADGGNGLSPASFAAYIGAPSGESQDDMTVKAGNGEYSFANQKR
ncbi:MAG: SusD/RagB family nutrient-binding outer membrane lipoprotein, partial [Cyclobacteriaceae bacterium]|nr:SusD/RagB family nutrient-binding outer membrane lipoprotein [Cyclobacteriaceae bacterium]